MDRPPHRSTEMVPKYHQAIFSSDLNNIMQHGENLMMGHLAVAGPATKSPVEEYWFKKLLTLLDAELPANWRQWPVNWLSAWDAFRGASLEDMGLRAVFIVNDITRICGLSLPLSPTQAFHIRMVVLTWELGRALVVDPSTKIHGPSSIFIEYYRRKLSPSHKIPPDMGEPRRIPSHVGVHSGTGPSEPMVAVGPASGRRTVSAPAAAGQPPTLADGPLEPQYLALMLPDHLVNPQDYKLSIKPSHLDESNKVVYDIRLNRNQSREISDSEEEQIQE